MIAPHPIPGGMLSRSMGMPSRRDRPPSIWDTHGISGNVFANPTASSSALFPQELNPWSSHVSERIHSSQAGKNENETPVQDQRCQSGPSVKNSIIRGEGDSSKNYGGRPTTTADFRSSFRQIPHTSIVCLLENKIQDRGMYLFTIFYEALLWIKEVEMVDSVADLKIFVIYEYFRVTGATDSVENYADLFTIALRNDDIQEFDSKWDGILLSMTTIPSDDILEGLYKLRIRESEKLKTVLELYDLEIHQKKAGPVYHRLKTMEKRSIEQDLRNKNLGARNGNYERNAVVKNQGTKQRGQRILGDCWQWENQRAVF